MCDDNAIYPEMTVETLLERFPQTAQVLIGHRTACVGCFLGHFHTLQEIATIYHLNLPDLLNELQHAIDPTSPMNPPDHDG